MKLVQWTLFIDMLGYREINGEINNEEKAIEFVDFMTENKSMFDLQNSNEIRGSYEQQKEQFNLYDFYEIQHAFISDSLVITYYPKEVASLKNKDKMFMHSANALFIITMRLQAFIFNCFATKGIFLRGGISNKYCYLKESFAVGDGLIDAYKVESEIAKYPRIAFSSNVIGNEDLMNKINFLNKAMYGDHKLIAEGPDGVSYLDYLTYNISTVDVQLPMVFQALQRSLPYHQNQVDSVQLFITRHKEAIAKKLIEVERNLLSASVENKSSMQRVVDKFIWLKDYHNSVVSKSNFSMHVL